MAAGVVAISSAAGAWASASARPSGATTSVIVVLRNQLHSTPDKLGYRNARDKAADTTQAPLVAGVRGTGGRVTNRFQLLNAFVATVSPAELKRLRSDPAVSAIYPNVSLGTTPSVSPAQPLAWGQNGSPATSALDGAIAPSTRPALTPIRERSSNERTSPPAVGDSLAICPEISGRRSKETGSLL
jgi:Peptidase inhibitor I9